jgi:predicted  nucleic acid-binding Zn-ribbon protein
MGAILDALHRLQQIENELNTYRVKEEALRRKARQVERQISKAESDFKAQRDAVMRCQVEIDQADLDIKSREESMGRHRQALNTAKSNKEYAAILTALNTEKADASKCESRVLEMMSRKDKLVAESKTFEEERARLEERLRKYQQELDRYLEETRTTFQGLEKERATAAANLPVSALATFERVAAHLEGDAMAETLRVSARGEEHICGGCNMSIPLEHINRLKSRDEIIECSSCGRILYIDPVGARRG